MPTGDWERSVHPDLVDEDESAAHPPPETAPSKAAGRLPRPAVEDPAASDASTPSEDAVESAPDDGSAAPDLSWLEQVREAVDTKDTAALIRLVGKNVPRDQLEKDEVMSGLIGQIGDRRARELQARQQKEAADRAKLEAAANNDLYTLGEMTQRELQQQLASQQAAQAAGPFMDGVVLFQKNLDDKIQQEVSGKTFGAGKSHAEGVAEYMQFITDEAVKLGVEKELRRRESALRKSVMTEVNGDEPVPERDSGTPGCVREVTDEQIAAMSLREYEALFDENGRPKPGVRHRSTRGIPVHRT